MSATASLAGYTRRHLQRIIQAHAHDPLVRRHQLEAEALAWEREGGQALREATSRATNWLRQATSNPEADPREVGAALSAAVASGHRLAEAGARRAKRLAPAEQPQAQRFDLQGFLSSVASACAEVRQLPPDQQGQAFEQLHQQLKDDQQGQALEPIDVEAQAVEALEPDS
jgi:hypothetical protein